jgi:hypothetical protein
MKTILALLTAMSFGTAYAQSAANNQGRPFGGMLDIERQEAKAQEGQRHMIEFNAQSIPSLIYSMEKLKAKGTDSENESGSNLSFNYAYSIHPNVQVGGRFSFFNGRSANNDTEELNVQVGGWFNTKAGDIQNSPYVSLHLGAGYAQTFGSNGGRDDLILSTLAVGKRFGMEDWGVKHLTWSPEVALVNTNSTTNSSFDYRQAFEFRVLQFSVIF